MNDTRDLQFPWFMASRSGARVLTAGEPKHRLGHRIERADGGQDGIFGEWSWDGEELVARNDRYGIGPIYYAGDADRVAVGTSPLQLIAQGVSNELDETALSVLFWTGTLVGDDTPFRQIKILSPNSVLRWRPGKLSIERNSPRPPAARDIDTDTALGAFHERFEQSISRRLAGPDERSVISLSGGLDSRYILLELHKQGHAPSFCMTHGLLPPSPSDDLAIARQLANRLGLDQLVLTEAEPRRGALTHYNVLTHFQAMVSAPFLITDMLALWGRASTAYEGLGGDTIARTSARSQNLRDAFAEGRLAEIPDIMFGRAGYDGLAEMLPDWVSRDRARERLRPIVEEAAEAANPWTWLIFWNHGRRRVSPGHLVSGRGVDRVFIPFLDQDVFDFAMSLPPSVHSTHDFQNQSMERAYPEFADIPYAEGARLPTSVERARAIAELSAYAARHNPSRLPSIARWASRRLKGRQLSPPLRIVNYLTQIETMAEPGEAARQLKAASQLTRLLPKPRGVMLRPGDPLPTPEGGPAA